MSGSPGDVGDVPVMYVKQRKDCRMSCDVGEATKGLENVGRRVIGISGSLIWSKTLMVLLFDPCGEFR